MLIDANCCGKQGYEYFIQEKIFNFFSSVADPDPGSGAFFDP
jgi:hypothetical protein